MIVDKCKCDLRTRLVGDGCKHCNPQITIDSLNDEIQTLRAQVASAEVFNLEQILHDPENQPSQYGTVPLKWYENLENKINRIRFNVEQVIDSLSGSSDMHAIRKQLQTAIDEESIVTNDKQSFADILEKSLSHAKTQLNNYMKLSEVKHDTK